MPIRDRQQWFLKEWRTFRGLSQEKLAERLGWHKGDISNLERRRRRYNQDVLEALAEALDLSSPGLLVMVNPLESTMWSTWEQASDAERRDIERLAAVVIHKKAG